MYVPTHGPLIEPSRADVQAAKPRFSSRPACLAPCVRRDGGGNSGAAGGPSVRTKFTDPAPKIGAILGLSPIVVWLDGRSAKIQGTQIIHRARRAFKRQIGSRNFRERKSATFGDGKGLALCAHGALVYAHMRARLSAHSAWGRTARSSLPRVTAVHAALLAAHATLHAAFHIAHPAALAVLAPPGTSLSPPGSLPSGGFSRSRCAGRRSRRP